MIRLTATCVCGSDLWSYRGTDAVDETTPMRHEHVGVVEHVGDDLRTVSVGDFVVGSSSPPTTPARSAVPAPSPGA